MDENIMAGLAQLWELPPYQFYMAGIERISAIVMHIVLSYLVYRAAKTRHLKFYFVAILLHTLVNMVTVIANNFISIVAVELILIAVVAVIALFINQMYRREEAL